MNCNNLDDSAMKCLSNFKFLSYLNLYEVILSDIGIKHLSNLNRLSTLKLGVYENLITDDGFDMLYEEFQNLIYLKTKMIQDSKKKLKI
jgi:hypothetical protein